MVQCSSFGKNGARGAAHRSETADGRLSKGRVEPKITKQQAAAAGAKESHGTEGRARGQLASCGPGLGSAAGRAAACREGRQAPLLGPKLLQAAQHLVCFLAQGRVQVWVRHHHALPAGRVQAREERESGAQSAQLSARHRFGSRTITRRLQRERDRGTSAQQSARPSSGRWRGVHGRGWGQVWRRWVPCLLPAWPGGLAAMGRGWTAPLDAACQARAAAPEGGAAAAGRALAKFGPPARPWLQTRLPHWPVHYDRRKSQSRSGCKRFCVAAHMPAALAAATPLGASSNTRQDDGSGAGCHIPAACRKMSGAGFPLLIWSPAKGAHAAAAVGDSAGARALCRKFQCG